MSDKKYYAGIDIGGTNVKYGIFDDSGKIIYKEQKPTLAEKGPEPLMHLITNIGERLLYYAADEDIDIRYLGVGSPGAIDIKKGKVVGPCPNIPGWTGMEIGENLNDRLNIPIYVDNDVHAMAVGEMYFGAGRGSNSIVCVTVGTGIGGAVIIGGKVVHGFSSSAGELGHITINFDGPECACGNRGCIESYCSSKYILSQVKSRLNKEMTESFKAILEGDIESVTIKKMFAAAKENDPVALGVISDTARYLGIGLAGIVNSLNPEILVIGGGITDGGAGFTDMVFENIKEHAFFSAVERLRVVKAALGNDAGFIGAGLLGEVN